MKQSSCLRAAYQTCQKVPIGSSMSQSRVHPQDLINRLPEACIAEIFRHVENPEDRQSCASVCWGWANVLVSLQPDFWGPFSVHQAVDPCLHLSDVDDAKLVAAVVDIHRRDVVTDLDLRCAPCGAVVSGVPQLTDNAIRFVTTVCHNLKSVCLINCLSLMNKAARIIASNCPALENIMMFQSSISDDGLSHVAKQCRNLKSLHIEGSLFVTEASLRSLVQDAKRLESLTLGSCHQFGEDVIMTFLMDQPYLDKLELKGMMAGVSHLNGARQSSVLHRHFCLFRQLRSLILVKCLGLQDLSMLKFASIHLRMLQHLVIDDCRGVTQLGLMCLVGNVMNLMKLKTIKLARFLFFTSAALMEVLSLFSETIESIILDSCDFGQVTPLYLGEAVVRECPKLKVIRLDHCESIMNLFLAWANIACCGLKELRLIGFPAHVHDVSWYGMSGCFPSILQHNGITKIELRRSCHVTDIHVDIIAKSCPGALQELILDECLNVLGNFVFFIRAHCPNLVQLGLNRIQIDDDHIRILMVVGFEHLEEVNLAGCPWITDSILHILAASFLPLLRRVNVADCAHITQGTVDYYRRLWEIVF